MEIKKTINKFLVILLFLITIFSTMFFGNISVSAKNFYVGPFDPSSGGKLIEAKINSGSYYLYGSTRLGEYGDMYYFNYYGPDYKWHYINFRGKETVGYGCPNVKMQVYNLQSALNKILGTNLATDGVFGPKTHATLKTFQSRYGLTPDGIAGKNTYNKINDLLP